MDDCFIVTIKREGADAPTTQFDKHFSLTMMKDQVDNIFRSIKVARKNGSVEQSQPY